MFLWQGQHSNPCNAVLLLNYCVWINCKLLTSVKVPQNLLLSDINLPFYPDFISQMIGAPLKSSMVVFSISKNIRTSRPCTALLLFVLYVSFIYNWWNGLLHVHFGATALQINSLFQWCISTCLHLTKHFKVTATLVFCINTLTLKTWKAEKRKKKKNPGKKKKQTTHCKQAVVFHALLA